MKITRRFLAILLIAVMTISAVACSSKNDNIHSNDHESADNIDYLDSSDTVNDSASIYDPSVSDSDNGIGTDKDNSTDSDSNTDKDNSTDKENDVIIDIFDTAEEFVDSFGSVPDAWSFLPNSFEVRNYVVDAESIPTYTDFMNVSEIPTNYIGKQMNVVVGVLNTCDVALGYVNLVYNSLNIVEASYQAFINDNPDNYSQFSGSTDTFSYNIALDGKVYLLSASVENINVTLFADGGKSIYGARIQLADNIVLKYTVTDSGIKIALNILNSSSTQIEFVRDTDKNAVLGYIYEFLGVEGQSVQSASTLLYSDKNYTTVVGTKGDFIPTADARNCEVYSSVTGHLIGTEVNETLGLINKTYDTLWYNLFDIDGINSIKKEDEKNGVNPDTIYINGKSEAIHSMFVSIFDTSRRFDIEFKKVMAYTYDAEKEKYVSIEYEVPMMFIQETNFNTFTTDYESKNDVIASVNVSKADRDAICNGYHVLVDMYEIIQNSVTQQDIINYCNANFKVN